MNSPLLEVRDLETGYGEIQVLRGISLQVRAGDRIGLFGPNGHGKTTLLRAISGLLPAWKGQIVFDGQRIDRRSPREIVERGIVHVAQGSALFPRMSVRENLILGAYSRRAWQKRKENLEKVFALFPRLAERKTQLCKTLSGGERQMVAIGMGLMGEGRVLILDEPTLGLSPKLKETLGEAIERVASSGITLVLVEQDVEFLVSLTDRLYLLEEGRITLEQKSGEHTLEHEQIMEMYFGGSDRDALAKVSGEQP